ncbi:MAG: BON domain-containing protein, partial [Gammaproteobacteria bacterium]
MGLFDFAKNIGAKVFGDKEDPTEQAAKIKSHIEADNPGIADLDVSVNEGVVSLKGEATSREALEKAVLLAGN